MTSNKDINMFEDMEPETVVLEDDDGNERECLILDKLNVDGSDYFVLLPFDPIIMKHVVDENGDEGLHMVDEDEWAKVEKAWNEMADEEFDGDDDDDDDE